MWLWKFKLRKYRIEVTFGAGVKNVKSHPGRIGTGLHQACPKVTKADSFHMAWVRAAQVVENPAPRGPPPVQCAGTRGNLRAAGQDCSAEVKPGRHL
jgi:hypothetical protein